MNGFTSRLFDFEDITTERFTIQFKQKVIVKPNFSFPPEQITGDVDARWI
jgi:hypothetical protein